MLNLFDCFGIFDSKLICANSYEQNGGDSLSELVSTPNIGLKLLLTMDLNKQFFLMIHKGNYWLIIKIFCIYMEI